MCQIHEYRRFSIIYPFRNKMQTSYIVFFSTRYPLFVRDRALLSLLIYILTKCSWPMLFATFLILSFSHILTCHNLLSSHNNSVVLNTKHTKGSILGFTYNLSKQDTEVNLDRFLVYGELYREVRDAMARAILSDDTDEFVVSLKV